MERIDVVTIIFRGEIELLRLQARSLARYLEAKTIGTILIVLNDVDERACKLEVSDILHEYGELQEKVQLVSPSEIFQWPPGLTGKFADIRQSVSGIIKKLTNRARTGWRGRTGWYIQQALKLAASRAATSRYILILDSKNHLVSGCGMDVFVDESGRPRAAPRAMDDYHFNWVRNAHLYFGIEPPNQNTPVMPTVTPFCVERDVLHEVIDAIEARSGPVQTFFRPMEQPVTEFTLIPAWCKRAYGSWRVKFGTGMPEPHSIYRNAEQGDVEQILEDVEKGNAHFFALHRAMAGKINEQQKTRITQIWLKCGLVDSSEEGLTIIENTTC